MSNPVPPPIKKFPAAKQRRLDQLLEKNSEGTITAAESAKLKDLVEEAERLMVANAKLLAKYGSNEGEIVPSGAVPITVWLTPQPASR